MRLARSALKWSLLAGRRHDRDDEALDEALVLFLASARALRA
jgi:hypothetical protein